MIKTERLTAYFAAALIIFKCLRSKTGYTPLYIQVNRRMVDRLHYFSIVKLLSFILDTFYCIMQKDSYNIKVLGENCELGFRRRDIAH